VTKVVTTAIYLGLFAGAWWFLQFRVRILGNTAAAKRRTQRNTALLGGAFGILVLETWVSSSARAYIGAIGIPIVLVAYALMLFLDIYRRRTQYGKH
jgi:hypothetical protein